MKSFRENPEGEENTQATRQSERELFALQMQQKADSVAADSPTWPHVLKFALRMEANLAANRHKGDRAGWLKDHPWDLVERVLDETVELEQCFRRLPANASMPNYIVCDDPEKTANECADVANFCMMVADRVTAILPTAKED